MLTILTSTVSQDLAKSRFPKPPFATTPTCIHRTARSMPNYWKTLWDITCCLQLEASCLYWEVFNGVGVDGVGVIFTFFYAFFPFFYAILPFFYAFLPFFCAFFPFFYAFFPFFYARGISLRPRLHRPRAKLPDYNRTSFASELLSLLTIVFWDPSFLLSVGGFLLTIGVFVLATVGRFLMGWCRC